MNLRNKAVSEEGAGVASTAATTGQEAPAPGTSRTAAAAAKPQPALSDPDVAPAIPRDEHHGRGGRYALVDGKRTPIDEDGQPLPATK